jgi:large subunit ribosomal protein L3
MAATKGLLAKKMGMTRLFAENGTVTPVTVMDAASNVVLALKSADGKDGYTAVQIGYGERTEKNITKAQAGNFKKAGVSPRRTVTEFRLDDTNGFEVGGHIAVADIFNEGDKVDVSGTSKGRGFAGVMKKFNFAGFIRSHGTHEFFRHGGSIGTRLTPGHVMKGKKMPGQMGNERVTVQNIEVAKIDADRNLIFLKGGVPGPKGTVLEIRVAVK